MKSVYTILRGMIKTGYLMSDKSVDIPVKSDKIKENEGRMIVNKQGKLRQSKD
jgi:hypothetical protein